MSAIVTNNFRIYSANQFIESFTEPSPTNMYLFIGRPQPWSVDSAPETPFDNEMNMSQIWDDMMSLKRIQSSNIRPAIVRRNWASNVVYDEYRHNYSIENPAYSGATNLYDSSFYVVNDELKVYKCISNNRNSPSTVQPTGTSLQIFTTADGYRWKYMYSVSVSDAQAFATSAFIPVVTDPLVQAVAVAGAIHHVHVSYGGSSQITSSVITINGDGSGAEGIGIIDAGRLDQVTITDPGSGYHTASVTVDGDAVAEPIIEPTGGHGFDAVRELGSRYVMIAVELEYAETGDVFTIENEYRRVGILQDPYNFGTSTVSTATTLASMKTLNLTGVSGTFLPDEYVTGESSGASGQIVDWNENINSIRYLNNSETGYTLFEDAEVVIGSVSGATGTIDTIDNPEVEKFSGRIVYVDNRVPMLRTTDQIDYISIIIKF